MLSKQSSWGSLEKAENIRLNALKNSFTTSISAKTRRRVLRLLHCAKCPDENETEWAKVCEPTAASGILQGLPQENETLHGRCIEIRLFGPWSARKQERGGRYCCRCAWLVLALYNILIDRWLRIGWQSVDGHVPQGRSASG